MTEPKMVKAMEYLDDDLIVAAAEEKKAAPRFTKKKVLVLLAACFMLVLSLATMGMDAEPAGPTEEQVRQSVLRWFDEHIAMYQDDPEMLAYYTKWRDIEIPDPYPAEWQNEDGSMKDFVTVEMLYEAFYDSLQYQFIMEDPVMQQALSTSVTITLDENRNVCMHTNAVVGEVKRDEEGNIISEKYSRGY